MYVYITPEFEAKANHYGLQKKVNKLRQDIESAEDIHKVQQDIFKRPLGKYLRLDAGRYRLTGSICSVDGQQIVILLKIFDHDREYDELSKEIRENSGKSKDLENLVSESEAEIKKDLKKIESSSEEEERPELPEEMSPWLKPPGLKLSAKENETIIYESEEWVNLFKNKEINKYWQTYYPLVEEILSAESEADNNAEKFENLPHVKLGSKKLNDKDKAKYILYSRISTNDSSSTVLFLIAPFSVKPSVEQIEEIAKKTGLYKNKKEQDKEEEVCIFSEAVSLEELTQLARRSYPDYLLAEKDFWLAIQEGEEESNLALSAEEMSLLEDFSTSRKEKKEKSSLPIFINGPAGSGKSTMLLYLFADYCYRKYDKNLEGDPLFLTYNERLLEVAKKGVTNLLSYHHEFLSRRTKPTFKVPNTNNFFKGFQQFLIEMLPLEESNNFREKQRYISFHRFQQLYQEKCNLPQAKNHNSALCWHVIRTFIKGYSCNSYMTPEDYQNPEIVNRKDLTVSLKNFKEIYETIWQKWYHKLVEEEGYWDDQDLIRKVIKGGYYRSEYGAVFCDEAQDFTKIELQLIMRLSLFSKYDLGKESSKEPNISLPFAFAGDPLQTLNPTGFRWESVKARFHDEVIKALDPSGKLNLKMNPQDLKFNYRSSPSIVRFTNVIQLWRSVFFDMPKLKPQKEWKKGDFPEPEKFILFDNIHPDELKENVQDTIIIVPCEEGGEKGYVERDDFLQKIFPLKKESDNDEVANKESDNNEPLKNVLSAIAAKGLEFDKVILYKFGECCDPAIWNELGTDEENKGRSLELEYYFNKLYVAASRAKKELFIIDTKEGNCRLWNYASSKDEINKFAEKSKNADVWDGNVGTVTRGLSASNMKEKDPLSNAEEYETKGLESESSELMRRAKQFYTSANEPNKANLCQAWALKFDEKFLEAGKAFMERCKLDEARECFWEGMCWEELVNCRDPETNKTKRTLAEFMVRENSSVTGILEFTKFLEKCDTNYQLADPFSPQLREVVNKYTDKILKKSETDFTPNDWGRLGAILKKLHIFGERTYNCAGKCFFWAGNDEEAIKCWELCGATQTLQYYQARVKNSNFPYNLEWLFKAEDYQGLTEELKNWDKSQIIDKQPLKNWARDLQKKKRYWDAVVIGIELDDLPLVKEFFNEAIKSGATLEQFRYLIKYLIEKNQWEEAITVIENRLPTVTASKEERTKLKCEIVAAIAESNLTEDEISVTNRPHYESFIKEVSLGNTFDLNFRQIGWAFEKIGNYRDTLEFYKPLCENDDEENSNHARQRWLITRAKQEMYHRNKREFDKADKISSEIKEKIRRWQINNKFLRSDSNLSKYGLDNPIKVQGLPNDIKLKQLENGNIKFKVGEIEVETKGESEQRVLYLEDTNSWKDFKVILHDKRVDGSATYKKELMDSESKLSFAVPSSNYSGDIFFSGDKKYRIELRFRDLVNQKVVIDIDFG